MIIGQRGLVKADFDHKLSVYEPEESEQSARLIQRCIPEVLVDSKRLPRLTRVAAHITAKKVAKASL